MPAASSDSHDGVISVFFRWALVTEFLNWSQYKSYSLDPNQGKEEKKGMVGGNEKHVTIYTYRNGQIQYSQPDWSQFRSTGFTLNPHSFLIDEITK